LPREGGGKVITATRYHLSRSGDFIRHARKADFNELPTKGDPQARLQPMHRGEIIMTMPQSHLVASHSVDRATFEDLDSGPGPWDIGKPRECFTAIADRVTSPVLDAGCGTGEHALFFAARGLRVTGIDFVEEAIARARRKAAERSVAVE